jgi:hypothetical protein
LTIKYSDYSKNAYGEKGLFWVCVAVIIYASFHRSEETVQQLFIENNILANALSEVDPEFWEKIA